MKHLIAYNIRKVFKNRWALLILFLVLLGFGFHTFYALASTGFKRIYSFYWVVRVYGQVLVFLLAFDLVHDTARGEAALFFSLPLPRWKYFLARYISRQMVLMIFCVPLIGWVLFLAYYNGLYTPRFGSYLVISFLSFIVTHSALHFWASIATHPYLHYLYWTLGVVLGDQLETFFTHVIPLPAIQTVGHTVAKVVNVFSDGPGDLSSYMLLWGPHYVVKVLLITFCPILIHLALGSYGMSGKEVNIR